MKCVARAAMLSLLALLMSGMARACPVPVYQYALEHWASDAYRITVFRPAGLSEDADAALDRLRQAAQGDGNRANLTLQEQEADAAGAPRLTVRFPAVTGMGTPVWSGALTLESVDALLHSPLRTRLGEALLKRTTAVWLLLEGGDPRVDDETEALLREQLARMEREILVPETAEWGGQTVTLDHRINFQVMRVSRDDPREQMLMRMLLASEADLETFSGEPMVFPVYGRGLLLYALIGRGINRWTIEEAVRFLTGPCSCQIKAANPGTDLLTDTDWASAITPLTPASVGATAGTGSFLRHLDESGLEPE